MAAQNISEEPIGRSRTNVYRTLSHGAIEPIRKTRSYSTNELPPLSLRDMLGEAERKVGGLKEQQQSLSSEILNSQSERQAVLLSIEMEFESLQKRVEQRKSQLIFSVTSAFDGYLEAMTSLSEGIEREIGALERSIEQTKAPADTTGLNALEVEDKMAGIRSELQESISESGEFPQEFNQARGHRPRITYQSREHAFQSLLDSIGWVDQQLDSSSVLEVLVPPTNPRDTSNFCPLAVATDIGRHVYILDDGREGGTLHVFIAGAWTDSINLHKETKLKKAPYSMCVAHGSIYVSYPDVDTIALIRKKNSEPTKLLNSHTLSSIKPPIKSPHGLCRLDRENVVVADTGNDRVLVLTRLHQLMRTIEGSEHAPIHKPTSVGACSDGMVAVLHSGGARVHVYCGNGELRWRTCSFEVWTDSETLLPFQPGRIALHRTGEFKEPEVFLTASYGGEQSILRYNLQKTWLCRMGRTGNKFGQFSDLRGIEYCPERECILACDYGNQRVQTFKY